MYAYRIVSLYIDITSIKNCNRSNYIKNHLNVQIIFIFTLINYLFNCLNYFCFYYNKITYDELLHICNA